VATTDAFTRRAVDREQRHRRVGADRGVVRAEAAPAGRARSGERGERNGARIPLPLEQRVEIGVPERTQADIVRSDG